VGLARCGTVSLYLGPPFVEIEMEMSIGRLSQIGALRDCVCLGPGPPFSL